MAVSTTKFCVKFLTYLFSQFVKKVYNTSYLLYGNIKSAMIKWQRHIDYISFLSLTHLEFQN